MAASAVVEWRIARGGYLLSADIMMPGNDFCLIAGPGADRDIRLSCGKASQVINPLTVRQSKYAER